ncbi:MAG: carboxylate-amine ligase [Gammaproteobacteria bacterium]|nr:carboxylate-amine ligase [Gammaproteobacteria bacterium]
MKEPSFTIGIEEEYLLVDRKSRDLIQDAPLDMLPKCEELLKGQVTPEFLQCQIEVGTRVCKTLGEARQDLSHLRRTVAQVAEGFGLGLIAASTHPFANWTEQKRTPKDRYATIARDMQAVVRRLMIGGMHVHVGIDDQDLRIDLMNQVSYVLPHLLALSTSSPFWVGEVTGLKSYRIAVWNEMPRTGLPEQFESFGVYQHHIDVLIQAGVIQDATQVWWDVRPSARFPTLEMRIADVCTRLEDTLCIAAIYLCWLRMLYRLRIANQRWRKYAPMLIKENRWRAQRYGLDKGLIDFGRGRIIPYPDLLEEIIAMVGEDAEYLGCVNELEHARKILTQGTSAHHQLRVYYQALDQGASQQEALIAVVDMLMEDTLHGVTT